MIVVEPVPEPQHKAGAQSGIEFPVAPIVAITKASIEQPRMHWRFPACPKDECPSNHSRQTGKAETGAGSALVRLTQFNLIIRVIDLNHRLSQQSAVETACAWVAMGSPSTFDILARYLRSACQEEGAL